MASACVNNIAMSPENFLDCSSSYPSFGWFSPRISFSGDFVDEESKPVKKPLNLEVGVSVKEVGDFEFRLDDSATMLSADELFSGGKLVPLQLSTIRPSVASMVSEEIRSVDEVKSCRKSEISVTDPYLFSPKAPRCSSGWKELLRLKKIQNPKHEVQKSTSVPWKNLNPQSLKIFLQRNPKSSSVDSSLSLPLLRDSDLESVTISSISSGPDHHDLPKFSLDSDKLNPDLISLNRNPPRKVRLVKPRTACENPKLDHPTGRVGRSPMRRVPDSNAIPAIGVSIDSPRMNSSGKVVFQSLERSSSSPSSFNGGPKINHKGVERSYSANVRVTPVLNVPVCSLRGSSKSGSVFGFGQLFSSAHKRDGTIRSHCNRNRTDRI